MATAHGVNACSFYRECSHERRPWWAGCGQFSLPHELSLPHFRIWADARYTHSGQDVCEDFYANDFGRLRIYSSIKPEARAIMEEVFAQDYMVVIATSPVFPLTAIEQRLEWAGVRDFDYALITSYENMHTCKPHLAYYREILDKIGCCAEECLMVGNDLEDDIVPAVKLGISSFWVTDAKPVATELTPQADWQGTLADFGKLVERGRLQLE